MFDLKDKLMAILADDITLEKAIEDMDDQNRKDLFKSLELLKKNAETTEMVKYDDNGQWSIKKAIKPGPTLDYSKINPKPDYGKIEREAHTIDYSDPKNVQVKKPWAEQLHGAIRLEQGLRKDRIRTH
jgi:hypothetical protein